ncbi:nucleotide-binding protein [Candidatus Woesearchaeota archaeon]|nr:nucleotide-binding protein [Candidatus Woesearchaeota archaeon]
MPNYIKKVVLDTNFLLIPGQFGVDIFAEFQRLCDFSYELVVLDAALKELDGIVADRTASAKDRAAAKLGIRLIKAKGVKVIKSHRKVFKTTDEAILGFATATGKANDKPVVVATQDRELRDKLASKDVAVIVLRQKRYLKFYQ